MKRKVEKYIYSKNIDGKHKLIDADGNLLIGNDIDGCVRAAREGISVVVSRPEKHIRKEPPVTIKVGSRPASTASLSSRKKRKTELNSFFSPAVAPKSAVAAALPVPSAKDKSELLEFCRTLRGGYVNGIYRSAIERRKMAESTTASGFGITKAFNDLNLTVEERERLPGFFKEHVMKNLQDYCAPPPATSKKITTRSNPLEGSATPKFKSVLNHQQLRPSPVMTKKERDAALNAAFLSFSPPPKAESSEATPLRSPLPGTSPLPGVFSSFSPFISLNYDDAMMQGISMTPSMIRSSGEELLAPNSWSQDVFNDTPHDDDEDMGEELVHSNSGPFLPTAEELQSEKQAIDLDIDAQLQAVAGGDEQSLHVSYFKDVVILLNQSNISFNFTSLRDLYLSLTCCLPMTTLPPSSPQPLRTPAHYE